MPDAFDPTPYLAELERRYGIPQRVFDAYQVFRASRKRLGVAAGQLDAPERPAPSMRGLYLMRIHGSYPKLTTAGAMQFGEHATQNVIPVDRAQLADYMRQRPIEVTPEQAARCTGPGHVLIRHAELTLGVGSFRAHESGGGTVQSMFPKTWAGVTLD